MTEYQDRTSFRAIDTLPLRDVTVDLLDLERVAEHVARAVERGRYAGPTAPLDYLRAKHYIVEEGDVLLTTPAALLCFGRQPQDIFPRAVVDLVHYRSVDAVSFEVAHLEKDIGGTIFDQIARVESYLWTNMHHGMTLDNTSSQRVELHEYPRVVIRELGVNMVAHRDYANIMSSSRVQLFRNRIEWANPGGLPAGITVSNILAAQASRNPGILAILYESGYVEAIGQGIDTVVTVLNRENLAPPLFEDSGSFFRVVVYGRPLDLFTDGDAYTHLNDRQRRILAFIRSQREVTPAGVSALFDQTVTSRSIQRDIKALADIGLIIITGTGRGRGVRYRIREDTI